MRQLHLVCHMTDARVRLETLHEVLRHGPAQRDLLFRPGGRGDCISNLSQRRYAGWLQTIESKDVIGYGRLDDRAGRARFRLERPHPRIRYDELTELDLGAFLHRTRMPDRQLQRT